MVCRGALHRGFARAVGFGHPTVIASESEDSMRQKGSRSGLLRDARNDVKTCLRDPAARYARMMPERFAPSEIRARGPGARCTRSLACSKESMRVSRHRYTGTPGIPARNGFNGFLRALAGDRALLPPSLTRIAPRNLTPASGCQDHTTLPSAAKRLRQRAACVHRIPHPTSVTIVIRPSCGVRDNDGR